MTEPQTDPWPPPPLRQPPAWLRPSPLDPPADVESEPPSRPPGRALVAMLVVLALVAGFVVARVTGTDAPGGEGSFERAPASGSSAPPAPRRAGPEPVEFVARNLIPSVVQIETGPGVGSGVIYDERGLILTAAHVVDSGVGEVTVRLSDGTRLEGAVVGVHDSTDVGVVRVRGGSLPAAPLAVGVPVRVGQLAVAIGSPFGLEGSVTAGIVSAVDRSLPAPGDVSMSVIQTDAPINPGNSGGALADRQGRVIGINDSIRSTSGANVGVGFAIPIDIAVTVAEALVRGEVPRLGYLGVSGREPASGQGGALVTEVVPGSPADEVGIRPGDLIVRFDGHAVEGISSLASRVRRTAPGTAVVVDVVRDGRHIEIRVEVGGQ